VEPLRIGLVGDRSDDVPAHVAIPPALRGAGRRLAVAVEPVWLPTDALPDDDALAAFDALWCVPASPYRDTDGALRAIRVARERERPFLGTCGGFQHALLMLARDLAGIDAAHAEYGDAEGELVIVPLECSLVGHEGAISYAPGTLMQEIMGADRSVERYHCSYGIDPEQVATLEQAGVIFGAHDDDGAPRALELAGHPFFLGTLFQPELAGDGTRAHPVIRAFAAAAVQRAAAPV